LLLYPYLYVPPTSPCSCVSSLSLEGEVVRKDTEAMKIDSVAGTIVEITNEQKVEMRSNEPKPAALSEKEEVGSGEKESEGATQEPSSSRTSLDKSMFL
jgi:hypothetical protein